VDLNLTSAQFFRLLSASDQEPSTTYFCLPLTKNPTVL
jgi:hypothetical protein